MKTFPFIKSRLFFILLLAFIIVGFLGFTIISAMSNEKKQLSSSQIDKVKSNLKIITSTPTMSSNPYTLIEAHKKQYDEIVQMGKPVVNYFIEEYKKGNIDGLNAWITAWICNEILGNKNPIKIWSEDHKNGWSSGGDWYEKYMEIKKIK